MIMKKISYQKMADTVIAKRKEQKLTQVQLAEMTGIHRAMISRLETLDYMPYIKCVSSILYCNFYPTSKNHPAALVLFSYNLIQKATPKLLSELHLLPVKILQVHDEVCRNAALFFQSCTIYPIPHHLFLILHQFLQGFPSISANIPQTSVCK